LVSAGYSANNISQSAAARRNASKGSEKRGNDLILSEKFDVVIATPLLADLEN
jgi:hypothetical protein